MKVPSSRLTKMEILRGYQMFSRVIAEGRTLQKGALRCFFLVAPRARGYVQVGFSVSRAVRTAVDRNQGRRWMREAYRRNRALLIGSPVAQSQAVSAVFLLRVRGGLARTKEFRESIDQTMIVLLKELHHHLAEKS